MTQSSPAPRNRTLRLSSQERNSLVSSMTTRSDRLSLTSDFGRLDQIFLGEMEDICRHIPSESVDLLILDPPYNLRRDFGGSTFQPLSMDQYACLFDGWLAQLDRSLKPSATIYVCSDWRTSAAIFPVLNSRFLVRNRISWEREKGRGSTTNWKSTAEDIWYCTRSADFKFYPDRVRLRREVVAPYRDSAGRPKDWIEDRAGSFRDTAPSNLWTDLTVPFWSMPENTDHPTQKPEKLIAKLVLASSDEGDLMLDPFLGSGTSAVVAKKLGRRYIGVEKEPDFAAVAQKRLDQILLGDPIQGYQNGVFWARNTGAAQQKASNHAADPSSVPDYADLFSG